MDFSTLKLRKKYCQKELNLNKILCRNMYKSVVKIVDQNGNIRIRESFCRSRAIEYAIKMLEIPREFRMDNLISEDRISSQAITKLAEVLVKFHKSAHTNDRTLHFGQPRVIRKKIYENFNTLSN